MEMDDLVADLARLIGEVSTDDVVLCGESFGGALSLSLALKHPNLVTGLVIVNSFPFIRSRWKLYVGPYALRLMPWGAMPVARRFTEAKIHSPHCDPDDLHEFRERSKAIGKRGYLKRIQILQSYDIRERLHELEAPTLFLAGDHDRLIPAVEEARFMSERAPFAEMEVLKGYGHVCLINHDLNLLDYIGPWYDRVGPGD